MKISFWESCLAILRSFSRQFFEARFDFQVNFYFPSVARRDFEARVVLRVDFSPVIFPTVRGGVKGGAKLVSHLFGQLSTITIPSRQSYGRKQTDLVLFHIFCFLWTYNSKLLGQLYYSKARLFKSLYVYIESIGFYITDILLLQILTLVSHPHVIYNPAQLTEIQSYVCIKMFPTVCKVYPVSDPKLIPIITKEMSKMYGQHSGTLSFFTLLPNLRNAQWAVFTQKCACFVTLIYEGHNFYSKLKVRGKLAGLKAFLHFKPDIRAQGRTVFQISIILKYTLKNLIYWGFFQFM